MSHDPDTLIRSLRARMVFQTRAFMALVELIYAYCRVGPLAKADAGMRALRDLEREAGPESKSQINVKAKSQVRSKAKSALKTATAMFTHMVREAVQCSREGSKLHDRYRDLLFKRDMLRAPEWRARVLRELGGMRRLALHDRAMRDRAMRARRHGQSHSQAKPPLSPAEKQLREAAQENRRAIAAIKIANNPHYVYVRVKGDRMGQFRLPAIPRGSRRTSAAAHHQDIFRRLTGRRAMALPPSAGKFKSAGPRTPSGKRYLKEHLVPVSPQEFRAAIFPGRPVVSGGGFDAPPDMRMTGTGPAYAPLSPSLRGPPR